MKEDTSTQAARLQHYIYEAESWARLLSFCKEELVHFKNRLAGMIADSEDENALLAGEKFQEDFLAQDGMCLYLIDELKRQNKLLQKDLYVDGELFKEVTRNQVKLRREIKKAEALFTEMKNRYAQYLSERYSEETG